MDTTGVHLSNSRSTAEYAVTSDVVTDGIPSHFGTPGSQTKSESVLNTLAPFTKANFDIYIHCGKFYFCFIQRS